MYSGSSAAASKKAKEDCTMAAEDLDIPEDVDADMSDTL